MILVLDLEWALKVSKAVDSTMEEPPKRPKGGILAGRGIFANERDNDSGSDDE